MPASRNRPQWVFCVKPSLSGRADLLRALAAENQEAGAAMAALLGYAETPAGEPIRWHPALEPRTGLSGEASGQTQTQYKPANVPFWRLESCRAVEQPPVMEPSPPVSLPPTATNRVWRNKPETRPVFAPLAPQQEVLTRLRQIAETRRTTNEIDVEAAVERLSQGRLLDEVPHRQRRAWGTEICIVEDRSRRLVPYWLDQEYITNVLRTLYPPSGVTVARIEEGEELPLIRWPKERRGDEMCPLPGSMLLVLGDLGCLAHQGDSLRRFWFQWGLQLHNQKIAAVALVPARTADIPPELSQVWTIVPWQASHPAAVQIPAQSATDIVHKLLTLLAPAVRLEPGLLRAVRCLLPEGRLDPGLEARVWQDAAIVSQHSVAATMDPEQRKGYRKQFISLPKELKELRGKVLELIRTQHGQLHPAIWFEEVIGLELKSQQEPVVAEDVKDAIRFLTTFFAKLKTSEQLSDDSAAWISRLADRLHKDDSRSPEIQKAIHDLCELVRPKTAESLVHDSFDPAMISTENQTTRHAELWQVADQLLIRSVTDKTQPPERGSPLGLLHAANGQLTLAVGEPEQEKTAFWQTGEPPTWAHDYGWDDVGPWATFRVDEVEQKMRWVPAGRFVMGSPEDEEGRWEEEGPQHEVQLTRGFWLFDTPCTQALWQAVTGENPSVFKGAQRPVEMVSWEDCQEFIAKLNELLPGLALCLPTEAQWEYACRAGTKTARYAEDLDAIAWYAENSDDETHPVKQKRPNAWGLYDMLGNVLEWCYDDQRAYTQERVIDPIGPLIPGVDRVVRGGGWFVDARVVRAARRSWGLSDFRGGDLGFRCASSSQSQPVLRRPMWSESERQAEPAQTATQRPKQRLLDLNKQSQFSVDIPDANILCFNTDRDRLRFVQLTKPEWADEIGRDKHGLWVIFKVDEVRQTMRWIPPGRFWMGSPSNSGEAFREEMPQHEVLLTRGFWLFDTPCTQALWQAVMGKNPSHFKGEQRPVEKISWGDCQEFVQNVNAKVNGLDLSLPTEAEWEYACRAGTDTLRYAEDLDKIAWYDKNSDDETHPVGQKDPNAWGLYDMLGNVDEWCHDGRREYTAERVIDPLGPLNPGADRVVRGGDWLCDAQLVRAALRDWPPPDFRRDYLGFRCASSGQASRIGSRGETDSGVSSARSETAPTDAGR